jgi:5'-deoxynucleotidase YfbR-like HD superfamily hydrolase
VSIDFFAPFPTPRLPVVNTAFRTHSGRMVQLHRPEDAEIAVEDIAHHLARLCRYNGSVDEFYSVASHCVYVSRALESEGHSWYTQAAGLLHDAAEAYIGDVTSGLKRVLPEYRALEKRWERAVQEHFAVCFPKGSAVAAAVKNADLRARLAEIRDLFHESPYPRELLLGGEGDLVAYPALVQAQPPDVGEWAWGARARELGLW